MPIDTLNFQAQNEEKSEIRHALDQKVDWCNSVYCVWFEACKPRLDEVLKSVYSRS